MGKCVCRDFFTFMLNYKRKSSSIAENFKKFINGTYSFKENRGGARLSILQ